MAKESKDNKQQDARAARKAEVTRESKIADEKTGGVFTKSFPVSFNIKKCAVSFSS